MSNTTGDRLAKQLVAVIMWEMDAQAGVRRPFDQMPVLIADSVLDFFDVRLKPGVTLPLPHRSVEVSMQVTDIADP